jgi:hypothetical protein
MSSSVGTKSSLCFRICAGLWFIGAAYLAAEIMLGGKFLQTTLESIFSTQMGHRYFFPDSIFVYIWLAIFSSGILAFCLARKDRFCGKISNAFVSGTTIPLLATFISTFRFIASPHGIKAATSSIASFLDYIPGTFFMFLAFSAPITVPVGIVAALLFYAVRKYHRRSEA